MVATRYLRVVRPDQSGSFRVTGLPPGRYAATAVETFEQGRQFVPDVQARLKAAGGCSRSTKAAPPPWTCR